MSEKVVDDEFDTVDEQVESAHQQAVTELRSKVQKAKAEALKKVSL